MQFDDHMYSVDFSSVQSRPVGDCSVHSIWADRHCAQESSLCDAMQQDWKSPLVFSGLLSHPAELHCIWVTFKNCIFVYTFSLETDISPADVCTADPLLKNDSDGELQTGQPRPQLVGTVMLSQSIQAASRTSDASHFTGRKHG